MKENKKINNEELYLVSWLLGGLPLVGLVALLKHYFKNDKLNDDIE